MTPNAEKSSASPRATTAHSHRSTAEITPRRDDSARALIAFTVVCLAIAVGALWAFYLARQALLVVYTSALLAIGFSPLVRIIEQQQLESYVLVPKLMDHQLGLSASGIIIALLLGGSLIGILGAILAVPTAAIVQVVWQRWAARE